MTAARRARFTGVVVTAVLLAAGGCAESSAPAGPADDPARTAKRVEPVAVAVSAPPACSLVDAADVSLYVAMAEWQVTAGDEAGRSVCRLDTPGFVVTAVTMVLPNAENPPSGLCAPEGTRPDPASAAEALCAYRGPEADSATTVVAASGVAVGVRVTGPDAEGKAAQLAVHALGHL